MNKKTAAELMTRNVLTVQADWGIDRLMEFLSDHRISGAPVVSDDGTPIGVVSHTDVARNGAVAEHDSGDTHRFYRRLEESLSPEEIAGFRIQLGSQVTVRDIMTPMVFAVDEGATVQEVAEMMITGRIHRVFVKSGARLTGVITAMDLLPLVRDM